MPGPIALFMTRLQPGGTERVMLHLARGLSDRGEQVDLVLAEARGGFLRAVPDPVRVVDLGARRTMTSVPALARYLREARPAILMAPQLHGLMAALAARSLARSPVPVVAAVHSTLSRLVEVRGRERRAFRIFPWLLKRLLPRADAVVAVSEGARADLARTLGLAEGEVEVIYNPVATPELERLAAGSPHPWLAEPDARVALGVGRLSPEKDFPTLVRAVVHARNASRADLRLILLGEGPERPRIEAEVEACGLASLVDMPGYVENPYAYMAGADVFVLSSAWEGLPTALIEALAVGCPVVSTDCPSGPREILQEGAFGALVPVGDAPALGRAVADVLAVPPDRERLRMRGRQFSIDAATERYLDLFRRTVGTARTV